MQARAHTNTEEGRSSAAWMPGDAQMEENKKGGCRDRELVERFKSCTVSVTITNNPKAMGPQKLKPLEQNDN